MVWRRVYATDPFGEMVSGAISLQARNRAEEYAARMPESDQWQASFDRPLPEVSGSVPDRPLVFRVDSDGIEIGCYGPEGYQPNQLLSELDETGTAKFSRMIVFYAAEEYSDISPHKVAEEVHTDDEDAWWDAYENYLAEQDG